MKIKLYNWVGSEGDFNTRQAVDSALSGQKPVFYLTDKVYNKLLKIYKYRWFLRLTCW